MHDKKSRAVLLRFPARRGRPKGLPRSTDTGTPELVMKRLLGETAEALDLCLERGLITLVQHWCGIHLRWLYTLRHGPPGVRAVDTTHLGGADIRPDDPQWRGAREKEYNEAVQKLAARGYAALVINLCIYNQRPAYLNKGRVLKPQAVKTLEGLRDALDMLADHWGRSSRK